MGGGMGGGLSAPAFSGGVWDSWPAWVVDAFPILDAETRAVHAFAESEKPKRK